MVRIMCHYQYRYLCTSDFEWKRRANGCPDLGLPAYLVPSSETRFCPRILFHVSPPLCLPQGPTSLVSPLLVCMQDKSAGARQVAQECLSVLIGAGTVQPSRVRAGTRDFPPAVMRQLKPALEKVLEASGICPQHELRPYSRFDSATCVF